MPTIRQLPSGLWNVQVRAKGHKARSASFPTKSEAQAWSEQQLRKIKDQLPARTLFNLGEQFVSIGLLGKRTRHEAHGQLMRICREFSELGLPTDLREINSHHINTYRLYRLGKVAGATCRKDLSLLSRIYKWGKREYLLDLPNPVDDIALPPPGKPRTRIVEPHELTQLLQALTPVMAMIVELAYETAMRRSEIIKLTPRMLHLDERYLDVIDGKTGDRTVPLTVRAVELLQTAKQNCPGPKARLFPITAHAVSTAFRRARERVGLDPAICLHQLRHTRITEVAKKGFNQAQIMMVSGHRDVRSVQRYTHLNVQDVIGLLD